MNIFFQTIIIIVMVMTLDIFPKSCCSVFSCSCPTLYPHRLYSPPGSSVHGDSPGKHTGEGCHAIFQGTFPTQGSNPDLPHCRQILFCLSHQGSPKKYWKSLSGVVIWSELAAAWKLILE